MTSAASATPQVFAGIAPPLPAEEQARADLYALMASLLLRPPDAALLAALAAADSLHSMQADNPLDAAWERLVAAAGLVDAEAVREEFDALFISIGTPQINPYASAYLAGFMMEKPLAALREDLAALGLARSPGSGECEDHLGALCEAMRLLITGVPGNAPQSLQQQRRFFMKHLAPWYARALDDIRRAEGANFYKNVADFCQAFIEIEFQAFEMDASSDMELA